MQIKGRTFLVTGGSSGLGAACAGQLVVAGANVIIVDLNSEEGEGLATELGDSAQFVKANVTDEADVRSAVSVALNSHGGLHGVINCAGIAIAAKVYSSRGIHRLEAFNKVIQVNLVGTFNVIRLTAEAMIAAQTFRLPPLRSLLNRIAATRLPAMPKGMDIIMNSVLPR